MTPEEVLALAERTEVDVEGGLSPRPLMSVPHPLSGESCCYYHGAMQQTLTASPGPGTAVVGASRTQAGVGCSLLPGGLVLLHLSRKLAAARRWASSALT